MYRFYCFGVFFFLEKKLHRTTKYVEKRKVQTKKVSKTWPSIPLKWKNVSKELLMFLQLGKNWGCLRKKKRSEIVQKVLIFSRSSLGLLYNNCWYFLTVLNRIQRVVFIWGRWDTSISTEELELLAQKLLTLTWIKKKINVPNSVLDKIFKRWINMHNISEEKAELANTSIHCFTVNGFQRLPCFLHSSSDRSV